MIKPEEIYKRLPDNRVPKKGFLKESFSSKFLFESLEILGPDFIDTFSKGIDILNSMKNNSFVMIGGGALQHYISTARQLSPDIDFVAADMQAFTEYCYNGNIELRPIETLPGLVGYKFLKNIDILDPSVDLIKSMALKKYRKLFIFGYPVKVVTPEVLFLMKYFTGRDKDLSDMMLLLSSHILDENELKKCISVLEKNHYCDYTNIKTLYSYIDSLNEF